MQLTVLGCRAGMPATGQASSGYLVSTGTTGILLDCGPGVLTVLSGQIDPATLDGVVISHLHSDHCYDLLPLGKSLLAGMFAYPTGNAPPQEHVEIAPIPLYVPAGGAAMLTALARLFPVATAPVLDKAFELAFDVREYRPAQRFAVGDVELSLHELRHSAPNCGVRLDAGDASLAYTGDTGVTEGLRTLARGADLLLAEASLETTDHGPHGHLSAADAARAATDAEVAMLVLTHFPTCDPAWLHARLAEAHGLFAGPVHLAAPLRQFDINPGKVRS